MPIHVLSGLRTGQARDETPFLARTERQHLPPVAWPENFREVGDVAEVTLFVEIRRHQEREALAVERSDDRDQPG